MKENGNIRLRLSTVIILIVAATVIISGIIIYILLSNVQEKEVLVYPDSMMQGQETGTKDNQNTIDRGIVSKEPEKIDEDTIKIRCALAYNIPTADGLNEIEDYIDILEIYVKGEKFERLNHLLEETSFEKINPAEYYKYNMALAVAGMFELTLHDGRVILLDTNEFAMCTKGEETFMFKISMDIVNEVEEIVSEEANKIFRNFEAESITISVNKIEGKEITITDKNQIDYLTDNLKYVKVKMKDEEMADEREEYTVMIGNDVKISIFGASIVGKVTENNESYYIAFVTKFSKIVSNMYKNYESGRVEEIKASEISARYKGENYTITDKDTVDRFLEILRVECEYNDHDFLQSYSEANFGDEDIIIQLENSKLVIPGNVTIGNRYYIDSKGKVWMIYGISEIENAFKEMIRLSSKLIKGRNYEKSNNSFNSCYSSYRSRICCYKKEPQTSFI